MKLLKKIHHLLFITEIETICQKIGYEGINPFNKIMRKIKINPPTKKIIEILHTSFNYTYLLLSITLAILYLTKPFSYLTHLLAITYLLITIPMITLWILLAGCPFTIIQKQVTQ